MTVTLPFYVHVCQGMTTPVHSTHYSLQRLLQIMCINCKKILSLTLLRENRPTDVSTFPFAAYTTTKLCACVFPNSFPFLTALQASQRNLKLRGVRLRWSVSYTYTAVCRLSCWLWSLAGRHVNDRWRSYSKVYPYWIGKTRIFDFAGKSEMTCVTETFKHPHVYHWRQYYMAFVMSSAVNWN